MTPRQSAIVTVAVVVLVAAAFVVEARQASPGATTTSSTSTQTSSSVNNVQGLQLRLAVNATSGSNGVAIGILADEYNTLATSNNVTAGKDWALQGLSLGSCGTLAYPFGVALYRGTYDVGNVSSGTHLQIFPIVPCPLMIRLVTGYLFQPSSDLAVILPGSPGNAQAMSANVTATQEYTFTPGGSAGSTPLAPGTYTAVAGDEWGSLVFAHFTVAAGGGTTTASTTSTPAGTGTLQASFSIGPTQPVCMANATVGPAPAPYSSLSAVITASSGTSETVPITWTSTGCAVSGTLTTHLAPGSYTLNLSSCTFMGCNSALPKDFTVAAGQTVVLSVSIDTGIR